MKLLKKTVSAALSLVLCGSLIAPSFAAVEFNKDEHVDAATGALKESGDYYLSGDVTLDKTLVIGAGISASIELNGHTLELNDQHSATVDSNGYLSSVTVQDSDVIEQGIWRKYENGSVIAVSGKEADLTVTDSSSYNEETGEYDKEGTGAISGGYSGNSVFVGPTGGGGGGVHVDNGGSFTMKGGSITENHANYMGGGIYANGGTVDLDGVAITKNSAGKLGGGIYAENGSTVTLNNVDISQNIGRTGAGGIQIGAIYKGRDDVTATITDSTITKNQVTSSYFGDSPSGGGVVVKTEGSLTMTDTEVVGNKVPGGTYGGIVAYGDVTINGGTVAENESKSGTGGIYVGNEGTVTKDDNVTICSNKGNVDEETVHGPAAWDEGEVTKEATCTAEGVMTYKCKYCGETKTKTIGRLEHTPGKAVRENVVDATCEAAGSYNSVVYCSGCNERLSSTEETIDRLEHTPGEAVRENVVDAQIGVAGSYEEVVKCTECGEDISREKKEIPALVPDPVIPDVPVVTPTEPEDPTVEIDEPDVPLAGLPIELEPEDRLTRGQLVKILHWMDSEPAAELSTFLDVLASSDYAEAIGWAQANGIALGVGGNRFAPDDYVTRSQLIDFLNRYAKYVGSELVLELDGEAGEVLTWAVAEEIINDFFARL